MTDQPNSKYTASQHHNKAGNLHSIAYLSGDRPAVNNNTRPSVLRREHAGSDRIETAGEKGCKQGASGCSLSPIINEDK